MSVTAISLSRDLLLELDEVLVTDAELELELVLVSLTLEEVLVTDAELELELVLVTDAELLEEPTTFTVISPM